MRAAQQPSSSCNPIPFRTNCVSSHKLCETIKGSDATEYESVTSTLTRTFPHSYEFDSILRSDSMTQLPQLASKSTQLVRVRHNLCGFLHKLWSCHEATHKSHANVGAARKPRTKSTQFARVAQFVRNPTQFVSQPSLCETRHSLCHNLCASSEATMRLVAAL
jgi:hypothetical protein